MNKNRSKEEIVADILSVVAERPKKTHIMYRANLSYTLLCKYLNLLIETRLVTYEKKTGIYALSPKGEDYLKAYAEYVRLKDMLESNALMVNQKESTLSGILKIER